MSSSWILQKPSMMLFSRFWRTPTHTSLDQKESTRTYFITFDIFDPAAVRGGKARSTAEEFLCPSGTLTSVDMTTKAPEATVTVTLPSVRLMLA